MKNNWFKHLQKTSDIWIDPETERKENKNAKIVGWGLGIGSALWIIFGFGGSAITGFLLFMLFLFGSYMLTED